MIPAELMRSGMRSRLEAAVFAARSAGAALVELRGTASHAVEVGDQLKTPADLAAEGWVLGYLKGLFPHDPILSEEEYEEEARGGGVWEAREAYWTVDALDGTRSFVDGYPTFCVQIAWIENGRPAVGVIYEPMAGTTYMAVEGAGAYRTRGEDMVRLSLRQPAGNGSPTFVDSTFPRGLPGELLHRFQGSFLECGSIGLKICRVAEGAADIYMKDLCFKLWDAAPGEVILQEAGGRLGLWTGAPIGYGGGEVRHRGILGASPQWFDRVCDLGQGDGQSLPARESKLPPSIT